MGTTGYLILALVGIAIVGYALHRAALFADRRGWVYYRTKPRFKGSSLGLLEEIYHPATSHVIEEEQSRRGGADHDESGDPPEV